MRPSIRPPAVSRADLVCIRPVLANHQNQNVQQTDKHMRATSSFPCERGFPPPRSFKSEPQGDVRHRTARVLD